MDSQSRGRSPSGGHAAHLRPVASHSHSTSPHQSAHDSSLNSIGAFSNNSYSNDQYSNDFQQDPQYSIDPQSSLLGFTQQASFNHIGANQSFTQGLQSHDTQHLGYSQQSNHLLPNTADLDISPGHQITSNSAGFPGLDYNPTNNNQSLDPSLFYDPQLLDAQSLQQSTLDPTNLSIDPMATMQHTHPTPPHLLQMDMRQPSRTPSPSPHHTPSPQQPMFNQPARPRNMSESLDPSSAAYPQGNYGNEWGTGANFRTHRRAPSDTLSEISVHSAHASPYLQELDSFDQNSHVSPMLNAQQDAPLFDNATFGLNQFTLNDHYNLQNHISPGHSPHISPNLMPQQHALPSFTPDNNFGLSSNIRGQYAGHNGYDMFPSLAQDAFPSLTGDSSPQEGQADQMSPPEINIDFAPPSKVNSFQMNDQQPDISGALSPPENYRRKRAKSDPYVSSRSPSPGVSRGRSPSLQPGSNGNYALTPSAIQLPPSRSPSPASRSRSRSDVSSGSQRDYILDLANPERPGAQAGGDPKKTQKHPATFQCTLCPKRFTRAYNLRSHLRTHTDERPFVCTVCGKAFARQHDRKRHEGLHSGEKKFVCRGTLKGTQSWGCGRRFARADALGRHFRSEAGRVCIKPLLDEEAAERKKNWLEEQQQHQLQSAQGFVAPNPIMQQPQLDPVLPAALLQMYPEFANLDWGAVSNQAGGMDDEYHGGRSSFDASSGGEWNDLSDNEMGGYEGVQSGNQQLHQQNSFGSSTAGWNGGEYLSDFEGR